MLLGQSLSAQDGSPLPENEPVKTASKNLLVQEESHLSIQPILAANAIADSADRADTETPVDQGSYKNRYWLLPDHTTLQFAGSIGLFSAGFGYRNPKNTLEGELLFGYVPASIGGDRLYTAALKGNWIPFVLFSDKFVRVYPLQTGVMAAYTFGSEFFGTQPDIYPKGYYPFSTAFHAYWQIGSRLSIPVNTNRLEFYYEVNANAEELITWAQNPDFIGPGKIFRLALGLKLNFEP